MSKDPTTLRIIAPYVRALFDFSVKKNIIHQVTADFYNLNIIFLNKKNTSEIVKYLNNPIINQNSKLFIFKKTIKFKVNKNTFNFLSVLVFKNRVHLLPSIILSYLNIIYKTATIKKVEIITATKFSRYHATLLSKKLKKLTQSRKIRLSINIDSTLIGGFLIKTSSQIIDFSIKNRLQNIANHLDVILEI